MPMVTSRTFRSGNSQAVRLPKEVALADDTAVTVIRSGEVLTIFPARPAIAAMIEQLRRLPRPGGIEVRDEAALSERPGL